MIVDPTVNADTDTEICLGCSESNQILETKHRKQSWLLKIDSFGCSGVLEQEKPPSHLCWWAGIKPWEPSACGWMVTGFAED
jgi:hypothetical protein